MAAAYDLAHRDSAEATVALGWRLGCAQVERTPHWPAVGPEDFVRWWRSITAPA